MDKMKEYRQTIDEIDQAIIDLFEKRMAVVKEIAAYKDKHDLDLVDPQREAELIRKNVDLLQNKSLIPYVEDLLKTIMGYSKSYQTTLKIKETNDEDSINRS